MGKKIVLGCLGVGVLVIVVGGYFVYTLLIKPVTESMNVLKDIHEANVRIVDRTHYQPPATGEMTEEQVERFVAVQSTIRQGLEDRFAEFQQKYEELGEDWEDRDPSVREIMDAWGGIVKLYRDAKRIQVDALNSEDFSLEEYRFVQRSFYDALGYEIFAFNVDQVAKAASEGDFDFDLGEFEEERKRYYDEVPEKNRELVAPYTESADTWIIFAWWGL